MHTDNINFPDDGRVTVGNLIVETSPDAVWRYLALARTFFDQGADEGAASCLYFVWQIALSPFATGTIQNWMAGQMAAKGIKLKDGVSEQFSALVRYALDVSKRKDRETFEQYTGCLKALWKLSDANDPTEFAEQLAVFTHLIHEQCKRVAN